jgi:hypothetical protein
MRCRDAVRYAGGTDKERITISGTVSMRTDVALGVSTGYIRFVIAQNQVHIVAGRRVSPPYRIPPCRISSHPISSIQDPLRTGSPLYQIPSI